MSAYIVNKDNLYNVITVITKIEGYSKTLKNIKERAILNPRSLFNELNRLNKFSISERYEDEKYNNFLSYNFDDKEYDEARKTFNQYQGLKSLRCYLYQSCEGRAGKTQLYELLNCVSNDFTYDIVNNIPQYENAVWG
tara:strand:+ start:948 stop:1361 length:414 start_codon:yes stop_codon:yes gene_type:complete